VTACRKIKESDENEEEKKRAGQEFSRKSDKNPIERRATTRNLFVEKTKVRQGHCRRLKKNPCRKKEVA
jgi:hypothetical protein